MLLNRRTHPVRTTAAAGILAISALGLTACGDDTSGTETGADVEDIQEEGVEEEGVEEDAVVDPYVGLYDTAFYEDLDTYVGEEVTVSADVNEILSPMSFTIAGTEDTSVESLLIVSASEMNDLESGLAVEVTGTVHEAFDLPTVESEMDVDLDDELYSEWDGEPYIEATAVDTSVEVDTEDT